MIKLALCTLAFSAVTNVASGCQIVDSPKDSRPIAVIGDSITESAESEVASKLNFEKEYVNGIGGIDLADGRKKLVPPALAIQPDVVVVELGINSAREVWDATDGTAVDTLLSNLKDVDCVVWVTPTSLSPSYFDHLGEGTLASRIDAMRRSVSRRLPQHSNAHLANFGTLELQHPEWYVDDHLHLTQQGQNAYAEFVADAVEENC